MSARKGRIGRAHHSLTTNAPHQRPVGAIPTVKKIEQQSVMGLPETRVAPPSPYSVSDLRPMYNSWFGNAAPRSGIGVFSVSITPEGDPESDAIESPAEGTSI